MSKMSLLDWSLVVGVIVYGVILGMYFERRYRFPLPHFFLATFFVAALGAILIAAYQAIRPSLFLP
jgi:hypothetical protein